MQLSKIMGVLVSVSTLAYLALVGVALTGISTVAVAQDAKPIKIGIIAPESMINGKAIFQGSRLAAKQINANGGVHGRPIKLMEYNSHGSASTAVRALQKAVRQDQVVAVSGVFISEIALTLQPWAARLGVPLIITGAGSPKITMRVHSQYDKYKNTFHTWLNADQQGLAVCDFANDILVDQLNYKTAAIMVENAAWAGPLASTYQDCLPKSGLKVLDTVSFSPDTENFGPIFSKITRSNPDVVMTGLAHVGVKPTVQWHNRRVPLLMAGVSAQAGASTFWDATNGATEGVITISAGAPDAATTSKSVLFHKAYMKAFDGQPAYDAYTSYDSIHILAHAIERSDSNNDEDLVRELEQTNYEGTWGRITFQDEGGKYTHGLVYGNEGVSGTMVQWQNGQQVAIWPKHASNSKLLVPDFAKQSD